VNRRLEGAITAVRDAIATAAAIPSDSVGIDDDVIIDLQLKWLELESLSLILEEIFAVTVPDYLWRSPLHRTAGSLAEWLIARSNEAAWTEAKRNKCA
jgi:hypothetical protein